MMKTWNTVKRFKTYVLYLKLKHIFTCCKSNMGLNEDDRRHSQPSGEWLILFKDPNPNRAERFK